MITHCDEALDFNNSTFDTKLALPEVMFFLKKRKRIREELMSKKSAMQFIKRLDEDAAFRNQLARDDRFCDKSLDVVMDLAKTEGYAFDKEELVLAGKELMNAELTKIRSQNAVRRPG